MDADAELDGFIDKFTPEVAALCRALLAKMKERVPGATILVYDNYNALAIGFGPSERTSEAVLSLAVYPSHVILYFMKGATFDDPHRLLEGTGRQGRHVRLTDAGKLDDPAVEHLVQQALASAQPPIDPHREQRLIIKSISANQRPRRPQP